MKTEKRDERQVIPKPTSLGVNQSVLTARRIEREVRMGRLFDPRIDLTSVQQQEIIGYANAGETSVVQLGEYFNSPALRYATFFLSNLLQKKQIHTLEMSSRADSIEQAKEAFALFAHSDPDFTKQEWEFYLENVAFMRLISSPTPIGSIINIIGFDRLASFIRQKDDARYFGPFLMLDTQHSIYHVTDAVYPAQEKMLTTVESGIERLRELAKSGIWPDITEGFSIIKSAAWTRLIVGEEKWKERSPINNTDWEIIMAWLAIMPKTTVPPFFVMLAFHTTILGADEAKLDPYTRNIEITLGKKPEYTQEEIKNPLPGVLEV